MKSIELYDILTIEDAGVDKDFTVANMLVHHDVTYLYLIEVDQEENLIEQNQMIVRRVVTDGEEAVEKVTDEKELQEVGRLFFELFKDLVDEMDEEGTVSEN